MHPHAPNHSMRLSKQTSDVIPENYFLACSGLVLLTAHRPLFLTRAAVCCRLLFVPDSGGLDSRHVRLTWLTSPNPHIHPLLYRLDNTDDLHPVCLVSLIRRSTQIPGSWISGFRNCVDSWIWNVILFVFNTTLWNATCRTGGFNLGPAKSPNSMDGKHAIESW